MQLNCVFFGVDTDTDDEMHTTGKFGFSYSASHI